MSKKNAPQLDLEAITAAINGNYDAKEKSVTEPVSYDPLKAPLFLDEPKAATAPAPSGTPAVAPEGGQMNITSPFIIVDLHQSADDANIIDSFVVHADGIEATPEAIIQHLQKVIDTIKEQNPST